MATSKKDIYAKFLLKIGDRDICSQLDDGDMIEILSKYLSESISCYFKNIRKDVTEENQTQPEIYKEKFVGDGIIKTFTLSKYSVGTIEKSTEPVFVKNDTILVNGVDYTFDDTTYTFTLIEAPLSTDEIVGGYNFTGEFFDTLSAQEQWVIATGMVYSWTSNKVYTLELMKHTMTPKDFKESSKANLLGKTIAVRERASLESMQRRNSYSYDGFKGFNK